MSAIVGAVGWRGDRDMPAFCKAALDDLRDLGPDRQLTHSVGQCAFGHALMPFLPGERGAAQPIRSQSGKLMLAADARIDNRAELTSALDAPSSLSDAELVLASWARWGEQTPDRLLGDFALAIWDDDRGELFLSRSPASSRTLFYHWDASFAAFATLPQPLCRLVPRALNVEEMARRLGGGAYFGTDESFFAGIHSVEPGTTVRIGPSGPRVERYWCPERVKTVERKRADAAEELAWEFRRAVNSCLRRTSGSASSHLSGGRDSSAVTGCAASILAGRDEPLFAFTGAPRADFPALGDSHAADESAAATAVARLYPNIRHVVSRSSKIPLCEALDRASRLHAAPMGSPANFAYWTRLQAEAARNGSRVLLTGANGNFSISLGGLAALSDVVREDGLGQWWRTAQDLSRSSSVPWRTLLNQSFGHRIPASLHRSLRNYVHGAAGVSGYPVFTGALRDAIHRVGAQAEDGPLASYRARVREIYRTIDYPDNLGLGLYGIDLRDPTADRRLIEYCLSLPARDIVGDQGRRPIYDLAFAALVPAEVRQSRVKGVQGADWFEIYDPDELRAGIRRYGENRAVREFIDIRQVERLLDAWPERFGHEARTYGLYANHLLVAVALASWLDVHF